MNISIIKLQNTPPHRVVLERYLKSVDGEFNPRLMELLSDLNLYATKLLTNGIVWVAKVDNKEVGLVALYANDMASKLAFISLVSTKKEYRGHGIARQLLTHCLEYLHTTPMHEVHLESNNPIAIKLYRSLGFEIYKEEDKYDLPYVWMKRKV